MKLKILQKSSIVITTGSFPFKYLGVPLHYEKLKREDIQLVVDVIIGRIPD
jgi:hypothetical protein